METLHDRASGRNNDSRQTEQDLRAELTVLAARYDSGAVSPAVFAVIRKLETEIAWRQHRGRP